MEMAKTPNFHLHPSSIALQSADDEHGVLASSVDGNDITAGVRFLSSDPSVFSVGTNGVCQPRTDGKAELIAVFGNRTNRIPVTVSQAGIRPSPSFCLDVEPVMTRLGCNNGACHGKQAGQNGFKLSLRGYAPEMDYLWLTGDVSGRRVNPAFPQDSLLIQKPLGKVPHEGGVRFEENSRYYRSLVDWIKARSPGPLAPEAEPQLERLEILPGDVAARPGQQQQLLARAHWSDGRVNDVTWLTQFFSNNEPTATVSPNGLVDVRRSGETSIRAHFQGLVSVIRFSVPFTNQIDASNFGLAQTAVDHPVFAKLRALRIPPSGPADDGSFLRRAMLDTIGALPTPEEVDAFARDARVDKRSRFVESLFKRSEFVDFWTLQLADLFQNRKERDHDVRGNKNVRAFQAWLRNEVAVNRPWNQLAREVLTASGDSVTSPQIGYYIYLVGEKQAPESEVTDAVAQSFLGTRIGCARCHNHPLERYTQDDFYHFAAFFDRVSLDRKGVTTLTVQSRDEREKLKRLVETEKKFHEAEAKFLATEGAELEAARKKFSDCRRELSDAKRDLAEVRTRAPRTNQPRTHRNMEARALDRMPMNWAGVEDPRTKLADWITGTNNASFNGAMVNRLWKHFMGTGLVEPVDDLRASNPPSNPELWDLLGKEFVNSGYDLRHVMRLILNSRVYQLSSETVPGNESETRFYSHYYARRLPAEVIADAISSATGVPDSFEGFPLGLRAVQLPEPTVNSYFLSLFGRSDRVTACACERNGEVTLPQLLHLQNGDEMFKKIGAEDGRLKAIQAGSTNLAATIDRLYVATLGRHPNPAELWKCTDLLGADQPEKGLPDLFWALLNSKEFAFNH